MKREKQLLKNTVIIAIGQICTKFVSFFLLPLYTSLLTTKEYGVVDLLNTFISLLLPLVFFQIDQGIFRFLIDVRNDNDKQKKYISTSFFTLLIQAIIYVIIFYIVSPFIKNEYKYFLVTNVISTIFSSYILQVSRGLGDNLSYSKGSLISGVGTVLLNVLFIVKYKMGAYGMLIATLIANILCFTYIFFKKKLYNFIKIEMLDKKVLKEIWKYSIPLIPNQLSWWIINASDRSIITMFLGVDTNGIYSASNKFSSICITFYNIFNMAWTESAASHFNDNDKSEFFSKILNNTIEIFSSICYLIIALMPFCFKFFITGKEYAAAYYQIPILLLSTLFNICVSFFGSVYVALKKSKEISKTSIYAAILNISFHLLLIKFIGLYAASISTLIAYVSMSIFRYIDIKKYINIEVDKKLCLTLLIILPGLLFSYYLIDFRLNLLSLIGIFIYTLYINRKNLNIIIRFLSKNRL